ncbi:MAG: hypothetical protein HXY40_05770 [Chloroflexi bacterium]|nr:hypothetical protein [Chloroflexota bacterium]
MMKLMLSVVIVGLALTLAACGGTGSEDGGAPILPVLTRQTPQEVVQTFLEAWNTSNYAAMYALVSTPSRERYPQSVFQARYEQVTQAIGISNLLFTIYETTLQGTTAAVRYDVSLESEGFAMINDTGRVMRLIDEGSAWRIAWSSMDILSGLAEGARVDVQARRPARGNIYDRNGQLLVEEGGSVVAMWSAQQNMADVEGCIDLLARLLRTWRPTLVQYFAAYAPETVFFLGEMDNDLYAQSSGELQSVCGVAPGTNLFFPYTRRRYDWNGAALHITGYLGQAQASDLAGGAAEGDLVGQMGAEQAYERELGGTPSRVVRIIEPGGAVLRELASSEGSASTSITLTIDRGLQRAAAQALADAFNYAQNNWAQFSPGGAVIVMDVNSGALLALASYPGFDPALFDPNSAYPGDFRTQAITAITSSQFRQPLRNHATQDQYFPGSTFKIITTAAAVNENLISPTEFFDCQLRWDGRPYGDTREFRVDWRNTDGLDAAGEITIAQALAASCNPFFYQYGALLYRDVGPQTLVDYARRMGLGAPTGLEPVMAEAAAELPTIDSAEEAIMSAVGQFDIQVTAIQMTRMVAGIANGGTLYRPYVVQQVGGVDEQPVTFTAAPTPLGDMGLSAAALDVVRTGMCLVTTDERLGTAYSLFENASYTVCGKTGTAQTGIQYPNAWFVAYAPAENPQIAVVVVVPNSREGSEVAAPIVRRVLDIYFGAPIEPYPEWWFENEYNLLDLPEGSTGG